MSEVPDTVMNDRCAGCAFRAGTEASESRWTAMLRDLCVLAGVPFECHDGGAGHLCRGFHDAFIVKVANGDYDRLPEWKNQLYRNLIVILQDYREAVARGDTFDVQAAIGGVAELS